MATILLIEDNPTAREHFRLVLEGAGYRVVEAGNGKQGVSAFRREPADLVVSDLFMPEMDGLEAIRQLRKLCPTVKVVAVSGGGDYVHGDFLHHAGLLGAVALLSKPLEERDLLDAVRRALEA
jgi:CheY-like chemotaxis protein